MRLLLALCLALAACAVDPVLLPDAETPDAGPCGGACGPGTVCSGGACVAGDAGVVDAGSAVDVGEDRPVVVDLGAPDVGLDAGAVDVPADVVVDAGPADVLPAGCTSGTPGNCCGIACTAPAHGAAACRGGRCVIAGCEAGYGNCDSNPANGCEVNIATDTANCGACGTPCAAGRRCNSLACELVCAPGRADCNGDPADGCEGVLTTRDQCGRCGVACSVRQACIEGVCR